MDMVKGFFATESKSNRVTDRQTRQKLKIFYQWVTEPDQWSNSCKELPLSSLTRIPVQPVIAIITQVTEWLQHTGMID